MIDSSGAVSPSDGHHQCQQTMAEEFLEGDETFSPNGQPTHSCGLTALQAESASQLSSVALIEDYIRYRNCIKPRAQQILFWCERRRPTFSITTASDMQVNGRHLLSRRDMKVCHALPFDLPFVIRFKAQNIKKKYMINREDGMKYNRSRQELDCSGQRRGSSCHVPLSRVCY
jgi:hypothetical protein